MGHSTAMSMPIYDLSRTKIELCHNGRWTNYRLTSVGQTEAGEIFKSLDHRLQTYIQNASEFVRRLTFSQLVRAIYKAYPEMKANSVFQG